MNTAQSPEPDAARSDLVHPLPMAAAALLALNDHLFKGGTLLPGWLTGKLSDVAGLFVFPILVVAVTEGGLRAAGYASSRRVAAATAATLTGLVFGSIKVFPGLAERASVLLGPTVCDPTDLLTLPSLFLAYWYLTRHTPERPSPRWAQALTVLAAGASSLATSQIHIVHGYATWEVAQADLRLVGCSAVEAWVSKSGKQGLGLTLRASSTDPECAVRVLDARLRLPTEEIRTTGALPADLRPGRLFTPAPSTASNYGQYSHPTSTPQPLPQPENAAYLYLPFPFDNEASWNEGERDATLALHLASGGQDLQWIVPLHHRYEGYHVDLPPVAPSPPPLTRAASPTSPTSPTSPAGRTFATPPAATSPAGPGGAR